MVFVGLMGMIDPPRPEAREAIKVCNEAGIRAVMITGDYRGTAMAVANDLGLMPPDARVLDGREMDALSDEELQLAAESTSVYARVSPDHKVRIVSALKSNGHIVSMTGDGVNDALALKTADIGVAMGITGTDVAKGTSEMILTDDNFATIVSAVHEGRILYNNIRKFVGYLLSCNVAEILVIFITTLILGSHFIPLLPIQLLWLNLITDSFPALALGQEKGEPDIMRHKPRDPKEPILNRLMVRTIIVQSIAIFSSVFIAFQLGLNCYPGDQNGASDGARTFAFTTLILCELIRSFSARSEHLSVFKIGIFKNGFLNKAFVLSLVLLLSVIYIPFLNPVFSTVPLNLTDWMKILPLSFIPFLAAEIDKWIRRKAQKDAT
jgi:Ca2+-transporting ATPase